MLWGALGLLAASEPVIAQSPPPDFAAVRKIVNSRCRFCHTAIPQEDGLNAASQPPKGIKFDSMADWQKFAPLIQDAAVTTRRMPPANSTHMTDEERAVLGRWFAAGAPIPGN